MRVTMWCLLAFTSLQGRSGQVHQVQREIKSAVEEKIHPYFQNAKVILRPEQHEVLVLTCMQGAGPLLVKMAGENFTQQLQQPGIAALVNRLVLAVEGYRYMELGFDTSIVTFDARTRRTSYREPSSLADYDQLYRQTCGL